MATGTQEERQSEATAVDQRRTAIKPCVVDEILPPQPLLLKSIMMVATRTPALDCYCLDCCQIQLGKSSQAPFM